MDASAVALQGRSETRKRKWMRRRHRRRGKMRRRLKKRVRRLVLDLKKNDLGAERKAKLQDQLKNLFEILRVRPVPTIDEAERQRRKKEKNARRRDKYRRKHHPHQRRPPRQRHRRRALRKRRRTQQNEEDRASSPKIPTSLPKTWNLAPVHDLRRHYIAVDTKTLYYIGRKYATEAVDDPMRNEFLLITNEKSFMRVGGAWFRRLFKLDQYHEINVPCDRPRDTKRLFFSNLISTDGVGCSVHLLKRKDLAETENRPTHAGAADPAKPRATPHRYLGDELRVIAVDPGRVNLICGVEKLADGTYKNYNLSQGQYYHDSHMSLNTRRRQRWNSGKPMKSSLLRLQQASPDLAGRRRSSLDDFLNYCRVLKDEMVTLWPHFTARRIARLRLDTYIHKRRTVDTFSQSLRGERSDPIPVLAYGDASVGLARGQRNERPTPCKWLLETLRKRFKVVMVNEAYTTARCFDCKVPVNLGGVPYRTASGELRTSRGLKLCRQSSATCRSNCLKSRDLNAAKNILFITSCRRRPAYLSTADDGIAAAIA